jgi:hypothetical protein
MDDQKENGNYKPIQTFHTKNRRDKTENSAGFPNLEGI